MNYTYILQSVKNGRYYIGSTKDLERRMLEHNRGGTKSLKFLLPVELVFKQEFASLLEARRMELRLKKLKNRAILKQIIQDGIIKLHRGH